MDIEEQFNLIAKEYDNNRKKFIPCYDDFYETTTRFIASNIQYPKSIIDLGAGTGLLTSFWYRYFPYSTYMLVDISDNMLEVAKKRFYGINNISFYYFNYIDTLPNEQFDMAISALSIHHLCYNDKERLFKTLFCRLTINGIFINYDQFCSDDVIINDGYNNSWITYLRSSGLTENDLLLWKGRRKLDKKISVSNEIKLLKSCGFSKVECAYSLQKFSMLIAIK